MACWRDDPRSIGELGDAVRSLRTLRHPFMQGGISLMLAGASIAGLFWRCPASKGRGIATPKNPKQLVRMGLLATLIFWVAIFAGNHLDLARGDVIDCGGPVTGFVFLAMLLIAPITMIVVWAIGSIIISGIADGRVSLSYWNSSNNAKSIFFSAIYAALGSLAILIGVSYATESSFLVTPACILFLYIFASSRAAGLASIAY